jgi:uridine kinase
MGGQWQVMRDLCSSPTIKAEATGKGLPFTPAQPFDASGRAVQIRLPGAVSEETLVKALSEGGKPNQTEMLRELVANLPKGVRVAVLMAGPSAAGKSTLAAQIKEFAGDRHVAEFPGDMYFRDADDPELPKTASGGVYWDDPKAMHFDEMAGAIARLIKDGHADIPVYDFSAVRPGGWHDPSCTGKGMRTDQVTPLDMGGDDILVIDSLHAANAQVVDKLKALDLPHATVYLDAEKTEDRLVRRMVRDFGVRGRSPQETLKDWDMSTYPGEVNFVRPTVMEMDPAQDLALFNKFPNDLGIDRAELDHKVEMLDRHGLAPTYPALKTADDGLGAFAVGEEKRLREAAADPKTSEAERAKDLAAADRIAAARQ